MQLSSHRLCRTLAAHSVHQYTGARSNILSVPMVTGIRQYLPESQNLWRDTRQGLYTYLRDRLIRQIAIVERGIAQGEDGSPTLASDVTNRLKQSLLPSPTAIRPPSNRTMQDPVVQDQPYASAQGSHRDQYTPDIAQSSGRAVGAGDKGCKVEDQSPLSNVSQLPKESASSIHSADSPLQIEQSHAYPTSSKERRRKREKAAEAAGKPFVVRKKTKVIEEHFDDCGEDVSQLLFDDENDESFITHNQLRCFDHFSDIWTFTSFMLSPERHCSCILSDDSLPSCNIHITSLPHDQESFHIGECFSLQDMEQALYRVTSFHPVTQQVTRLYRDHVVPCIISFVAFRSDDHPTLCGSS